MSWILNLLFGSRAKKAKSIKAETKEKIISDWRAIDAQIKGGTPSQLKQALITADKTLDNILRDMFEAEKMADRLKIAKDYFDYDLYQRVWDAHKMRNNIVHESGYDPSHILIEKSIRDLRKAVSTLGNILI